MRQTSRPSEPGSFSSRGWLLAPLLLISVLAAAYLLIAPLSADHAAQTFRTELFDLSGPTVWNNYWFGGHFLPSYSLLAPAIGAWIGFRTMGVLAAVGTVALFGLIARREWGDRAKYGVVWFAASVAISLYSGRITFALGVLVATAAVAVAQRGHRATSLGLAATTGLASPVAALFLACLGFSHFLTSRLERRSDRRGLELAGAAFGVSAAVALLFPGGGDEPYVLSSFAPAIGLTLAAAVFVPADQRLIRVGFLTYAAALFAAFVLDTPMGGNANRLGTLLLGPLLAISVAVSGVAMRRFHRILLVLLFLAIGAWQMVPVARDLNQVHQQAAVEPSFYQPLEVALAPRLAAQPARVEVVPVQSHWESARTAPAFPLARGWERQTDRQLNALFYGDELTPQAYRHWLDGLAVAWVAVPRTTLDYAGRREAVLVTGGLDYLREVPVGGRWRLFKVLDPTPMADPPARMTSLTANGFSVVSPRSGSFTVRVRHNPYFRVVSGAGCVLQQGENWTRISFFRPGRISVKSEFSPAARFENDLRCRP